MFPKKRPLSHTPALTRCPAPFHIISLGMNPTLPSPADAPQPAPPSLDGDDPIDATGAVIRERETSDPGGPGARESRTREGAIPRYALGYIRLTT